MRPTVRGRLLDGFLTVLVALRWYVLGLVAIVIALNWIHRYL